MHVHAYLTLHAGDTESNGEWRFKSSVGARAIEGTREGADHEEKSGN